jgi:hypothetical protein
MERVVQRITSADGTKREVAVATSLHFAGDGHAHWHVRDLQLYTLDLITNTTPIGVGAKGGFCFFDNRLYQPALANAPSAPVYQWCGDPGDLSVTMGLSVGWGDVYDVALPDQYIDITGLPMGMYRLRAVADPKQLFVEQDTINNATTVVLVIDQGSVRSLGRAVYLPFTAVADRAEQ